MSQVNSDMRKKMKFLKRRMAWLSARVAIKGDGYSFDRQEMAVLGWAIRELEQVYPELKEVKYEGDL